MIIMLLHCSDLLRCMFVLCARLSHCDVNVSFPNPVAFVDLSCDVHQCPLL